MLPVFNKLSNTNLCTQVFKKAINEPRDMSKLLDKKSLSITGIPTCTPAVQLVASSLLPLCLVTDPIIVPLQRLGYQLPGG